MRKKLLALIFIISKLSFIFAQTKEEFYQLINEISVKNSVDIIKTNEAKKIIAYKEKSLPILANFFTNNTLTNIKSDCLKRDLTKGEIAIIIADKIEGMPYFQLTCIQNCTLEFCKNNPNLIEYYFSFIQKDNKKSFTEKYIDWLKSTKRKPKK